MYSMRNHANARTFHTEQIVNLIGREHGDRNDQIRIRCCAPSLLRKARSEFRR